MSKFYGRAVPVILLSALFACMAGVYYVVSALPDYPGWLDLLFALIALLFFSAAFLLFAPAKSPAESPQDHTERYRVLFDINPLPMWLVDMESQAFLDVNQAAVHKYGYSRSEFLSMHLHDLRPEEALFGETDPGRETGYSCVRSWRHRDRDDQVLEAEACWHPLRYSNVRAALVWIIDVTSQRRAEESFRTSENNYYRLLETMSEGVINTDLEGRVQYINSRFCEMTGYSRDELIGRIGYRLLTPPEMSGFFSEQIKRRNSGMSDAYEVEVVKKSGTRMWVRVNASPVHSENGSVIGHIAIHTDITAHKRTIEALKNSEHLFRSLVELAPIGVVSLNEEGQFLLANKAFHHMIGYSEFELKYLTFLDLTHPEDREDSRRYFYETVSGRDLAQIEKRYYSKDGQVMWGRVTVSAVRDEQQRFMYTIAMVEDITERKRTDEKLKHTSQELNTFFYQASHDLKGPVASIIGLTNLALDETDHSKSPQYFGMINRSAMRLNSILSNLMESIRIKEGFVRRKLIQLPELVDDVIKSLEHMEGFRGIQVEREVRSPVEFYSDPELLSSVLQNLLENAIKYRNRSREDCYVHVLAAPSMSGIEITIRDNGIGIDKSLHEKVFTIFYKGNVKSKGTGLGLYIVRTIVDRLNGTINLESEEGAGAAFTIYLPSLHINSSENRLI